jgi:hypothetical protein
MKSIRLSLMLLLFSGSTMAQEFPGFRTGNYTGANGVFFNPANIADSRHKWHFNLLSFHASIANDNASFSLSDLKSAIDNDELEDQLTGTGAGLTTAMVNATIHGPSLMISTGAKSSIAISTRSRVLVNAIEIDGELADRLIDESSGNSSSFNILSNAKNRVNMNAWTEFGFTYSRILMEQGEHFLKGGLTLKYLAGAANAYLGVDNLTGQVDDDLITGDPYLSNSTGRLQIGFGGVNFSDFDWNDLTSFRSSGFGGDIGFVYEYRPGGDRLAVDAFDNKYRFRIGLALLDLGSIRYKRDLARSGGYDINITGGERLNLSEVEANDLDELKAYFDSRPQFFTPIPGATTANYNVSLPGSLNLDLDYRFTKRFYLNVGGMVSLTNSDKNIYNGQQFHSVTVTPRIESSSFGLYVPIQYHTLSKLNAGVALRYGPLFVGSGSLLTAMTGESKQADIYMGLRFGAMKKEKKKKKASTITDKEELGL